MTNDGDFAHRLALPSYQVPKTYITEVAGVVSEQTLAAPPRHHPRGRTGASDFCQDRFHCW